MSDSGVERPSAGNHGDVSFHEALRVWLRVAASSFGGPAGQIAVMQRILVDEKRWFSQNRFLHALNYTMLLPGPEAQQLATYGGWMLHGWRGGLVAGGLFILPGFLSILALSVLYAGFRNVAIVHAVFFGLKPAVLAIVLEAMVRIGSKALRNGFMVAIAAAAFVAIFVFGVPFPWIVLGAGLLGYAGQKVWEDRFLVIQAPNAGKPATEARLFDDRAAAAERPPLVRSLLTAAVWLIVWWLPVLALVVFLGSKHILVTESLFFSKVAVVTFGGAYAVLAYIAQQAVEVHAWLAPGEMLDGLGMAETTPGPLIQVVQFVGFMGAYRNPGAMNPMAVGLVASIVVTWVTFVPCFLWIFVGAPYIEYLRGRKALTAALSAITAAVVGVILNLALWFGVNTLFGETRQLGAPFHMSVPVLETLNPAAALIGVVAFVLLFGLRWSIFRTMGIGVFLGIAHVFLFSGMI